MVNRRLVFILLLPLITMATQAVAADDLATKAAEVHEHTIDALQTMAVAMFIAFGFIGKDYLHGTKKGIAFHFLAAIFVFCTAGSLVSSYFARIDLSRMLAAKMFVPHELSPAYAYQASLLLVAGGALFFFAIRGRK